MHLILLRHTLPVLSADVCYGSLDIALAASAAADFAQVLSVLPAFDRIISSPLQRCRLLAAHIGAHTGKSVILEPGLKEMDFGAWQGRAWDDIAIAEIDEWAADFEHGRPHGGESVAQLRQRLKVIALQLQTSQKRPGETVLAVTHAGVIRALVAMTRRTAEEGDERNIQIGYGEYVALNLADV
ncbi:MAG: alpha-ribazole phosphatase [Candidatus Azotimanducaceae bacterium]|jgi:alpha-ribazole phosphatase